MIYECWKGWIGKGNIAVSVELIPPCRREASHNVICFASVEASRAHAGPSVRQFFASASKISVVSDTVAVAVISVTRGLISYVSASG